MNDETRSEVAAIADPINAIVRELLTMSGGGRGRIAEIAGADDAADLIGWVLGIRRPTAEQAQRLRNAHAMLTQINAENNGTATDPKRTSDSSAGKERQPEFLAQLADESTGAYLVTTRGAVYVVDLDHRVTQRFQRTGVSYETATLRRDGDAVRLLRLMQCRVGESLILVLELGLNPPRPTLRPSTEVISIVRV